MSKDQREIARKLRILRPAEETGHVAKTCRYFGVGRSSFIRWREAYRKHGNAGLVNRPPIPKWHANRIPTVIWRLWELTISRLMKLRLLIRVFATKEFLKVSLKISAGVA